MPSVMSIRKNMIAQPTEPGSVAIASGYTTNTRPGPKAHKHTHISRYIYTYLLVCLVMILKFLISCGRLGWLVIFPVHKLIKEKVKVSVFI